MECKDCSEEVNSDETKIYNFFLQIILITFRYTLYIKLQQYSSMNKTLLFFVCIIYSYTGLSQWTDTGSFSYTFDNIAIGTNANPNNRNLHVFDSQNPGISLFDGNGAILEFGIATNNGSYMPFATSRDAVIRTGGSQSGNLILSTWSPNGAIKFGTGSNYNLVSERMSIDVNGKVKIGAVSTPGNYSLYVEKGILTEQVCIALKNTAEWADHVFSIDYDLMPLTKLKDYISKNHHLPKIPSSSEVAQDGIKLKQIITLQMEKIEELTLYMIKANEQINELKSELKILKKHIE